MGGLLVGVAVGLAGSGVGCEDELELLLVGLLIMK